MASRSGRPAADPEVFELVEVGVELATPRRCWWNPLPRTHRTPGRKACRPSGASTTPAPRRRTGNVYSCSECSLETFTASMPREVTKTIRLLPSQASAVTGEPGVDPLGHSTLAWLPSAPSTTIWPLPSGSVSARATLKPSGDIATAAAGVVLNATGAWPSGKTTAPSAAAGVALAAGELASGELGGVAGGVGEPVGLVEALAEGVAAGVAGAALPSVTPGAPAGPQKASPSAAPGHRGRLEHGPRGGGRAGRQCRLGPEVDGDVGVEGLAVLALQRRLGNGHLVGGVSGQGVDGGDHQGLGGLPGDGDLGGGLDLQRGQHRRLVLLIHRLVEAEGDGLAGIDGLLMAHRDDHGQVTRGRGAQAEDGDDRRRGDRGAQRERPPGGQPAGTEPVAEAATRGGRRPDVDPRREARPALSAARASSSQPGSEDWTGTAGRGPARAGSRGPSGRARAARGRRRRARRARGRSGRGARSRHLSGDR